MKLFGRASVCARTCAAASVFEHVGAHGCVDARMQAALSSVYVSGDTHVNMIVDVGLNVNVNRHIHVYVYVYVYAT